MQAQRSMRPPLVWASWMVIVFALMVVRSVPTPPGRPDAIDESLILAAPLATGLFASVSRSWFAVWSMVFVALVGAWCAWTNNTRLYLSFIYGDPRKHVWWWGWVGAWLLVLARLAPSAVWTYQDRWSRRALIAQGRCPACGYDLRATPERCPECGRAVEPNHVRS